MKINVHYRWLGLLSCVLWLDAHAATATSPLAYGPDVNEEFQYECEVRLNLGDEEVRLAGTTIYHVEASSEKQMRLRFKGGLKETRKSNRAHRVIRLPTLPRLGTRFGTPNRGTTTTTNTLTLSSKGETIALKGESQLPYLLGNLSLLPFETLPPNDTDRWQANTKMAVLAKDSSNSWSPFGPRFDSNDRDLRAADTKVRYRIIRQDEKEVVVEKKIELVLSPTQEKAQLQITGQGEWTFSKTQQMPKSMDFKYDLLIEKEGVTVSIPLTLKYHLLTKAEIKAKQEAAIQRATEAKRVAEERKAKATRPVTDAEKSKWISALASDEDFDQVRTLQELAGRTPPNRHDDVIDSIGKLLEHDNRAVAMTAKMALKKWDANYRRASELESMYNGSAPLKDTGILVDSDTSLYVGEVVQIKETHGWWKAAEVTELLPSGRVEVQMRDHWKERKLVERSKMQLPPAEYIQPVSPPAQASLATEMRTWKDASGLFKLRAKLFSRASDKIILVGEDGNQMTIPIDKLSEADQAFLKEQPKIENPFQSVGESGLR